MGQYLIPSVPPTWSRAWGTWGMGWRENSPRFAQVQVWRQTRANIPGEKKLDFSLRHNVLAAKRFSYLFSMTGAGAHVKKGILMRRGM